MTAGECKWLARLSRLPPPRRRLRAEAPGAARHNELRRRGPPRLGGPACTPAWEEERAREWLSTGERLRFARECEANARPLSCHLINVWKRQGSRAQRG